MPILNVAVYFIVAFAKIISLERIMTNIVAGSNQIRYMQPQTG